MKAMRRYRNLSDSVRFKRYCELDERGCWLWIGPVSPRGYAKFHIDGKTVWAHRWAYKKVFGDLDDKMDLHHETCSSKLCVNPWHVVPTSHADHARFHRREILRSIVSEIIRDASSVTIEVRK